MSDSDPIPHGNVALLIDADMRAPNIHEMFGIANVTSYEHLAELVRQGHLVSVKGDEIYMPHLERLAIPMAFIPFAVWPNRQSCLTRNPDDLRNLFRAPGKDNGRAATLPRARVARVLINFLRAREHVGLAHYCLEALDGLRQ